jgi:SNF2 family DNA or RNA helicase
VQSGVYPPHETRVPLFPYQREGMLHLAFNERALLADEMGLGKTIQAIAACALLHRLGKAARVLVVTPASLKTEWEEQIQRFSGLPYRLVFGPHRERLRGLEDPAFFTIVNYEQMVRDVLEVNRLLHPDVVVLDEAQRIKNWNTKTAQAIKRLQSRYAFVLTGTPIENRIDELYSIVDFLDPSIFGPLFRFNREFYELDERGRRRNTAISICCTTGSAPCCCAAGKPMWKQNCPGAPIEISLSPSVIDSLRPTRTTRLRS